MTSHILCRAIAPAALALFAFSIAPAFGAGTHSGGPGSAEAGSAATVAQANRTVQVAMRDNYYEPESIHVKPGETVRFVVQNHGSLVHEFNIGTPQMHAAHQGEMMMMVQHGVLTSDEFRPEAAAGMDHSMDHNHANSVLLEPGESGEVVWTFPGGGTLEFACNVPGHYQAGMVGDIDLVQ